MTEQLSPRQQTPHARIQQIFELAHEAANYLNDVEPRQLRWNSYQGMHSQARYQLMSFSGEVALWQHRRNKQNYNNVVGIHAVHPDAGITGSWYHADRPDLLTFVLATLQGRNSRGEFFTAEELVIRERPKSPSWDDIALSRVSCGNLKMQPMKIAYQLSQLDQIETKLTEFIEQPDTDDTTRLMITSAPVVADQF